MTDAYAEQRIKRIDDMLETRTVLDNQQAGVLALCEIARQLARLGDLYEAQIDKPHMAQVSIRVRKPKPKTDEMQALDTDGIPGGSTLPGAE